jgi:hypothetical protein
VLCVGKRVWLGSGPNEPGSAESCWARQGLRWGSARYWLVRVCVIPSHTHRQREFMSASMSKTSMSPDLYRELPVLWRVRSADYSNRAKRDGAWDLLAQFTREKIPDAGTPHSSGIITAAATCFDELTLDTEMHEKSLESAHASPAPESSSPSRTREPDSNVYGHLNMQHSSVRATGKRNQLPASIGQTFREREMTSHTAHACRQSLRICT